MRRGQHRYSALMVKFQLPSRLNTTLSRTNITDAVTMRNFHPVRHRQGKIEFAKILVKCRLVQVSANSSRSRGKFDPNARFIAKDRFKPVC
jgi:hypothetical protein